MDWYKKILKKCELNISILEIIFVLTIVLNVGVVIGENINQKKVKEIVDEQTNKTIDAINNNNQNINQLMILTTPTPTPILTTTPTPTEILTPTPIQVLGSETSNYLGMVEAKPNTTVNIYENPTLNSVIINTANSNTLLFYTEKANDWYHVELVDQNKTGWVTSDSVQEINNEKNN
jgi:hypothetical protein